MKILVKGIDAYIEGYCWWWYANLKFVKSDGKEAILNWNENNKKRLS